jgi:AraC-like DNA-binding protein
MTVTFTLSDWDELWEQPAHFCPSQLRLDDFETLSVVPASLGQGYVRSLEVCPGVWLDVSDQKFHQDWWIQIPAHAHLVQYIVYLSGFMPDTKMYPTFGEQRGYLSGSGIAPSDTMQYVRSQRSIDISVHLLPEVFADFFAGMTGATEALMKVLVKSNDWKASFFPRITPAMRRVTQHILETPFHGSTRQFYLQAKVFELLSLQLQPILCDQRLCDPAPRRKPDTIARIYHAKEVLNSRLESPPALLELARLVGVSDRTLQRGFRDVFGTTVVGYLIQQRLNQAEQLLRERQCTVAEVANRVGYSHLGHFAAGFKRKFGITPSECLVGQRSTTDKILQSTGTGMR